VRIAAAAHLGLVTERASAADDPPPTRAAEPLG
jgi:hypothetical protein